MGINNLNAKIEKITKFSQSRRKVLVSFFNKLNIELQIDVFREQKNHFFMLKNQQIEAELLGYCAFLLSIESYYKLSILSKFKNNSQDLHAIKKLEHIEVKKYRKTKIKEKREKILNYFSFINTLRNDGYSFRSIADALRSKHRLDVSHTYVMSIYKELKSD